MADDAPPVFGDYDEAVCRYATEEAEARMDAWARPFVCRNPALIPPRQHLYGKHYTRRFIGATVSPGGLGKTQLGLGDACAMASGRGLLGVLPVSRLRVWHWNGEDPFEETERRIAAIRLHFGLSASDLEGYLFAGSGREAPLTIAEQTRDGFTIHRPNVAAIEALLLRHRIDVFMIDPFVSSHRVTENDNSAINDVVKEWAGLADRANAAGELTHHTRKGNGGEITVEDGRGASALLYAARSARVLNPMTEEEAGLSGVENRAPFFRVTNGKANLAPRSEDSDWYKFESVSLGNGEGLDSGDSIGVVTRYSLPGALSGISDADLAEVQRRVNAGRFRANVQAADWIGKVVADVLNVDLSTKGGRTKVASILSKWMKEGFFTPVDGLTAKREIKQFIEVGRSVAELPNP